MEEIQPNYYSIIPANVRYDKNLKANEKLLYGEITALTHKKGYCFASNNYFAELYGVSKTSISKWINNLIKYGYVKSVIKYKIGTKEILNRYLTIVVHPIEEKFNTPIEEKLTDNNTSINNTSIIGKMNFPSDENHLILPLETEKIEKKKSSEQKRKKFEPPTKEEVIKYFDEKGYSKEQGLTAFNYYDVADWKDARGNKVVNWKQKMIAVWFKPEHKKKSSGNEGGTFDINDY